MDESLGLALQPDRTRYTLGTFLDDIALRHGPRTALRHQAPDDTSWQALSYGELRSASRVLARGLIGAGVVKGARVAVLMANRPEWVSAAFAVALAGGVLVPVNTYATPEERDYILRHSDASLLLMQPRLSKHDFVGELEARHPEIAAGVPGRLRCSALPQLRRIVCLDARGSGSGIEGFERLHELAEDVDEELLDAVAREVRPADDGILIYTSGTTAHPKGVLHRQRAPVIQSWRFAEDMGLVPEDRVFTAQPFFWTAGIVMSLGATLAAGASLIVEQVFSPERALALIESERVTTLHAWPHQEKAMAEHESAASRDLSSLRKIEFASPLARLAGIETDEWGTYGSYGLSETFTLASSLPASAPALRRRETSGRPLPGMRIRIVDLDSGEAIEEGGRRGEISLAGVTLMAGYYKVEPELYLDEFGYFHTQDGGSWDDEGYLHWHGRLSNLIKTGGANVSPLEIEGALADRDDLRLAQAVGVPHSVLGEVVVLCVLPKAGVTIDEAELDGWLRARLSSYKVPRRILAFGEDQLEFTGNQKLQVGPLRDLALARLRQEGTEIDGVRYSVDPAAEA